MTPNSHQRIVLASASSARLRVMQLAGLDPEVAVSGVDETTGELGTADAVVVLAERKASAVAERFSGRLVLGCDSMLDVDGTSLGKPGNEEDAVAVWKVLSGRVATLYTGHCLIAGEGTLVSASAATVVRFGTPDADEIAAYVATGEPMSLAGAFSIDGFGAPFVDGIDGDPGNVLGLSLPLLRRLLADVGVRITDLWRPEASAG